ncbi:MFS transporter [Iningainema tapete]|uniref:MFS transporter n=1 Tax=Iningainema tapete BLCC-T55 TaxID=2748662 RepID=A0A8J6XFN5_9CYAN|nr:MFS transporter [Iningainema tapete]MBD2773168.1 MFS transporter [Iningainema tapete BLCC-T55]
MDFTQLKKAGSVTPSQETTSETALSPTLKPSTRFSKDAIRRSLKASTLDAFFAAVFSMATTGILLSNFLVELNATPVIFGTLASIPMLVNLIQPLGAYLSERTTSRFRHSLKTYGTSRSLWLILVIGILLTCWGKVSTTQLQILTIVIVLLSYLSGALGNASWLSWVATLVPRRLRGRYFGLRNSITSLTNLVCVPLAGFTISRWPGGILQGYGVVLFVGIISGLVSLACQSFQIDINPSEQNATFVKPSQPTNQPRVEISTASVEQVENTVSEESQVSTVSERNSESEPSKQKVISSLPSRIRKTISNNLNFFTFLLYFSSWTFAANLSIPFFNFYLFNTLELDVSWVSVYGSLQAGANLLMLILWGKLADKIGNRTILLLVVSMATATPVLWLQVGVTPLDIFLWLPLLHIFIGITWAGLDLCNNNLQIGVAPIQNRAMYFSIVAAVAGVSGASGTIIGGLVAQNHSFGGLSGLFALSSVCRFLSLIPLLFVQETRSQSFFQMFLKAGGTRQEAEGS